MPAGGIETTRAVVTGAVGTDKADASLLNNVKFDRFATSSEVPYPTTENIAMETAVVFTPDQLSTRDVIANPYPAYSQLRDRSPFSYVDLPAGTVPGIEGEIRAWALMKYDDVYGALRDHDTFSSSGNPVIGKASPPLVMIFDDPPRHTRFRRLVNKTFTLRRVEALTPWIAAVADELLNAVGQQSIDIIEHYTVPLPVKVIARMLGIPGEEYEMFKRWSDAFLSLTSMDNRERMQNLKEMGGYFGKIAAARRAQGAEDLITALVEAEVEGEKLEEWEILGFCILLLIAGNETTTNLIGNILNILVERPALWQQLRSDRSLVETVIEETLRYESPVQRISRKATRNVQISGVNIPEGDLVRVYFGAALARAEAKVTLNRLLDRFSGIECGTAPGVRQTVSTALFGFQYLPLAFKQ